MAKKPPIGGIGGSVGGSARTPKKPGWLNPTAKKPKPPSYKPIASRHTAGPTGIGGGLSGRAVVPTQTRPKTKPATLPAPRTTPSTPNMTGPPRPPDVAPITPDPVRTTAGADGGGGSGVDPSIAALMAAAFGQGKDPFKAALPLVNQIIAAQQKAAQTAYQQQLDQGNTEAQRVQALYAAAAQAINDLHTAQQAQGAYQGAANSQAAFAQGFSTGMQNELARNADTVNNAVAAVGGPSSQNIDPGQAQAAGNVAYGLGGYLPARTLTQQGASAYGMLAGIPSATAGLGGFYAAGSLQKAQQAANDWLKQQQANIAAQRGSLTAQYAQLYDTMNARKQATAQNALLYQTNVANTQTKNQLAQDKLNYEIAQADSRSRNSFASLYGVDPVTGQPTLAGRRYLLAQQKALTGPKPTTKQVQMSVTKARQIASQAYNGFYHLDGADTPLTQAQLVAMMNKQKVTSVDALQGVVKSGLTYQEAMRKILDQIGGIPNALVIAQRALNSLWVRPGFDYSFDANGNRIWVKAATGRPVVPFQIRLKRKKG